MMETLYMAIYNTPTNLAIAEVTEATNVSPWTMVHVALRTQDTDLMSPIIRPIRGKIYRDLGVAR